MKEVVRLEKGTCLHLWVTQGLPFQAPQQWWFMVLNEGKGLLFSLRLLSDSFQPLCLWD